MNRQAAGKSGELAVGRYLREKGYAILSANYRCRMGEIDIIASDGQYICFVEVKTRSEGFRYAPADAVDSAKQKRILAAAQLYLSQQSSGLQPRFDIAEVFIEHGKIGKIHIIENAFEGDRR